MKFAATSIAAIAFTSTPIKAIADLFIRFAPFALRSRAHTLRLILASSRSLAKCNPCLVRKILFINPSGVCRNIENVFLVSTSARLRNLPHLLRE